MSEYFDPNKVIFTALLRASESNYGAQRTLENDDIVYKLKSVRAVLDKLSEHQKYRNKEYLQISNTIIQDKGGTQFELVSYNGVTYTVQDGSGKQSQIEGARIFTFDDRDALEFEILLNTRPSKQ